MQLTDKQYAVLGAPLNANRVRHLDGQSHLEAWDVRRYLIRTFGFGGFDITTTSLEFVKETEHPPGSIKKKNGRTNDRTAWSVIYRAQVRLTLKAPDGLPIASYEDGAIGDAQNQVTLGDAHDLAMKTALSQALKRCAVNLGDQFGLSLYNKGKSDPVVLWTAVAPTAGAKADVPEDAPVEGGELDETQPPDEPPERPAAEPVPANPGALRAIIAGAGAERGMDRDAIARDFYEWTKGDQIGKCTDVAVLQEYLKHLNTRPVAA